MFKEVSLPLAFYNRDTWLKVAFFSVSVIMAAFSLYFTDGLVSKLEEREKQQIELYAETIRYVMTSDENADINFFFERIKKINENNTIPVIWKDGSGHLNSINIPLNESSTMDERQMVLKLKLQEIIAEKNKPIEMDMGFQKEYIYYGNSKLLKLLRYYPLSQLTVVLIIGFLGYIFFSYSRRAEQNKVWVGLAKETAHQLGTPLSSLTAWVEILRNEPLINPDIVTELGKDIQRLDTITTRFSNIGSIPVLKEENLLELISNFINYLKIRISTKVTIDIQSSLLPNQSAKINKYLFEWVIENICKNAVDAMEGVGKLHVSVAASLDSVNIDISDTGKGIPQNQLKTIFEPGFSTKKRGWGLGLSLVKRIVNDYHKGRVFVLESTLDEGTTFRISIPL